LAIITLQAHGMVKGRALAARLGVHESTVSRDLKFVRRVRREYRKSNGCEMWPQSFRWLADGRGYETKFHWQEGVRLR
jgi:IS30 family transposase